MNIASEFIEKHWPLTGVSIKPVPVQGSGGTVGIIEAKEGRFTYKIAGSWKTPSALERDLGVFDFLNHKGFHHISRLLKTNDGRNMVDTADTLVFIYEFVEGDTPPATPETYAELARVLAELHSITDFPFESDYRVAEASKERIAEAGNYAFKDEYVKILQSIPDFTHLTLVPIHTELTPQNCIRTSTGNIVAIDWDEAGLGPAVLDLGISLINHFVTEDLEILSDNAHAFYQTYFGFRHMDDAEKKNIFEAGLFSACSWIGYGDTDKRWRRIQWALVNRSVVEKLYLG